MVLNNAIAQKLPKVQEQSIKAPATIKIDGKATEWDNQFQAYNPGSRIFYTLSNDDENLYLIARMEEMNGNFKAIGKGITLTIQPQKGADKDKKPVVITFPTKSKVADREKIHDNVHWIYSIKDNKRKRDSVQTLTNKMIATAFKQIDVSGLSEVSDASIPIYNLQGIRVAGQINNEAQYVYELAIPLKYLAVVTDDSGTINYSIKVNAPAEEGGLRLNNYAGASDDMLYQLHSTEFTGVYTLAK